MTNKHDGGPAFPIPNATDMDGYVYAPEASGMSLRDYAAIHADIPWKLVTDIADREEYRLPAGELLQIAAEMRYAYADAMLAEREK